MTDADKEPYRTPKLNTFAINIVKIYFAISRKRVVKKAPKIAFLNLIFCLGTIKYTKVIAIKTNTIGRMTPIKTPVTLLISIKGSKS